MKARKVATLAGRSTFTSFRQPKPCPRCGKNTTGVESLDLCRRCFDLSGLENEHSDGYHRDAPHPDCPECREEKNPATV